MIKKLFIIGLLTGIGHLVTLFSLKFISKNTGEISIAFIGKLDSLSLLIVSIVAFGLQLSATRELALLDDWKEEYYATQSARFTLSIFLFFFGFFGFFTTKNYLFFIAPIIALNADYALYGRGKPIIGAFIALVRILIPTLTLVFSSIYFLDELALHYSVSILFAYFLTGILVSKVLKVSWLVKPKIKSVQKYLRHFRIGLASFAFFFIGIGIINILDYFYDDKSIAVGYLALKLYMIFKGVRRIIVQSFFKELKDISISIKIDYFAMIVGVVFLISLTLFQKPIILLLFDDKYITYTTTFLVLGIAGFLSSITTSSGTRLLLKKQDKQYSNNIIIASTITILSSLFFLFLFESHAFFISLAILVGEIVLSVLNIISLNEKNYLNNRIKIIFPIFIISLLFIPVKLYLPNNIFTLVLSLIFFGIVVFFHTQNKLKFI